MAKTTFYDNARGHLELTVGFECFTHCWRSYSDIQGKEQQWKGCSFAQNFNLLSCIWWGLVSCTITSNPFFFSIQREISIYI